ncbi:uncharacterized protein LOC142819112 isoform X1 [Pelodiscus sinensis]|uniref:uncharacterized protein LOC142819112 isoform X1 n=1 Tax=Pelodiscus sinensis TaxID=13735 RepID=UPI003F6AF16E
METQMLQTLTPYLSFQTLKHRPVSGHWGHGIAAGSRKGAHVSLSLSLAGCWAVTGPGSVRGRPGGSVTVECGYEKGYEDYSKFWCREGIWRETRLCSDGHLVETTERETEVTQGRFSIRDNRTQRVFTVTVENLTLADAGKYQCGVERALLQTDLRHTVSVSVSPDTTSQKPTTSTPSMTQHSTSPSPPESTSTLTTVTEGKSSISAYQDTTTSVHSSDSIIFYILTPCVLLVLLLLLIAAVLLVRGSKRRKKALSGATVQKDKKIKLSNLAAGNNAADSSPEYAVVAPPAATSQTGFYSNVNTLPNSVNPDCSYEEIHLHPQRSEGTEEISYATVMISTPEQQSIYANVEQHPKTTCPANPQEAILYSDVKKKPKH